MKFTNPSEMTASAHPCTAIVCAYNEEQTVTGVVEALRQTRSVEEIIVVDDGSTDRTFEMLQTFARDERVRAIRLEHNQGKGCALATGIEAASNSVLLFVDADLTNWNADYAEIVLEALLDHRAEMVIGYPLRDGDTLDVLDAFGLIRGLSGERALWREDVLPLLPDLRTSRYGAETLLNLYYRRMDRRIQIVPLPGLFHPVKVEKERLPDALRSYQREAAEIAVTLREHTHMALAAYGLDQAAWAGRLENARRGVYHRWVCALDEISMWLYRGTRRMEKRAVDQPLPDVSLREPTQARGRGAAEWDATQR